VELVKGLSELCSLYIKDNPMMERTRNCRKGLIAALPKLAYMDDRPVFELERVGAEAW
jgi:hypothetical protein